MKEDEGGRDFRLMGASMRLSGEKAELSCAQVKLCSLIHANEPSGSRVMIRFVALIMNTTVKLRVSSYASPGTSLLWYILLRRILF